MGSGHHVDCLLANSHCRNCHDHRRCLCAFHARSALQQPSAETHSAKSFPRRSPPKNHNHLRLALPKNLQHRLPMSEGLRRQGRRLGQVLRGYFTYHAVPTNNACLQRFKLHVTSPLAARSLCRQPSKVEARCANRARRDLCAGGAQQ